MKNMFLLAFLLLPAFAVAAPENYNIPLPDPASPAAQMPTVTRLNVQIDALNTGLCRRLSITTANCNQANVCAAGNAVGGSSCTPTQAINAGLRVWDKTQSGREEYVRFGIVYPAITKGIRFTPALATQLRCDRWENGNASQRDIQCAEVGAPYPATVALGCDLSCQ